MANWRRENDSIVAALTRQDAEFLMRELAFVTGSCSNAQRSPCPLCLHRQLIVDKLKEALNPVNEASRQS